MEARHARNSMVRMLWRLARPRPAGKALDLSTLLGAQASERLFRAFVAHPDGQTLLGQRPDLASALSDREELLALPAGSLGRACARAIRPTPAGERPAASLATAHAWFAERLRTLPELWRVLAGFEASGDGDAELLAFSGRVLRQPRIAALLFLAALLGPRRGWWRVQRGRIAAWRAGGETVPLLVIPYEQFFPCSLRVVRGTLRIGAVDSGLRDLAVLGPHGVEGAS